MNSRIPSDMQIVESWKKNVLPWTVAVREGKIESRKQVTDEAIIDAVLSCSPYSVLDVGCGEGWLTRELSSNNINAIGVDVVPGLIDAARRAGGGEFQVKSYEEIASGKLNISVDVVVSNFSLLGKESVEELFTTIPSLLNYQGSFIVQTLNPIAACGDQPYLDGWRDGSWKGFSSDFCDPAPWYFRTMESWLKLFERCGLRLRELREPRHPITQKPASVIFIAEAAE